MRRRSCSARIGTASACVLTVGCRTGCRGVAVEVAGPDLAGTTTGEDLQQDYRHGLRIVDPVSGGPGVVAARDGQLIVAGQSDQRQRRGAPRINRPAIGTPKTVSCQR